MSLSLEKSQLALLKELQRNTSDRLTYQKLTTLLMLHHHYPVSEIAELLGIDVSTVYRHQHHYESSPDLDNYLKQHYHPCAGKLNSPQLVAIKAYVKEHLCHCADQVRLHIEQTYQIPYTTDGVIALLHRLGFSYKQTRLIPSGADEGKQLRWQEEFRQLEAHLPEKEVILFADGVHPHHNTAPTYAWIEKGTEKEIPANTGRKRVNINGAINPAEPTQVVFHECDTINALTTIVFLKCIEQRYPHKQAIHLFVDNARYYRSTLVAEFVRTSRIHMHFLPPYSPNLNPIERLWRLMKKEVIKSEYTPHFSVFQQRIRDFFLHIDKYKDKLESLINTNFQIIKPIDMGLQSSLR
jgi:transposase